ncbi:HAD-IIB family hydrolase [Marinobacter nanhaiticus D15-8W]|uniref:sucrose-phosphate synthase n=1 Tax=Marinobacter nanhaiticus D15-8W TaxID=626887 RepID=N6WQ85_9GAMM|nr:HAD-IIB family hydrolase [Marinobacter nanhaiticus]ENO13202.1 HAD-IIB family hydrolase [Marinobacter nanhaiticus D15-8W]BES70563.1 HAD-IIB family hydrolase [Marinobacter nanhaiticus D15-8W]
MDKDITRAHPFLDLSDNDILTDSKAPGSRSGVVMHIALQGCLRGGDIPYGLTADTGGHIRYLLELVEALSRRPEVEHQIIVTRAFDDPKLGAEYTAAEESLGPNVTLWRCPGQTSDYLAKEALWSELPALTEALVDRMREQGIRPDLVHAHYADAGIMAYQLKRRLGIPYVFTAHSLGASKLQHASPDKPISRTLRRRIRYEELAVRGASSMIASSEHEAKFQYGLYRCHDLNRTKVNPPGCDLQNFSRPAPQSTTHEVDTLLKRFLREPELPCLLAIARPVAKKNLKALIKAYGENPELRQKANLVLIAGTRSRIEACEPEAQQVWLEMLQLIDDYDLYGHVAYPKQHELRQIPAIYQWAAQRKGVFVNPALNEPFGLTLLEAAAAGLPVVATQEGGPIDIVRRCGHGLVVPPTDTRAIAEGCRQILFDDVGWQRLSARGRKNVAFYSWSRHARQYVMETGLVTRDSLPVLGHERPTRILASDMDGTLLGDHRGLERLKQWLAQNRECLFVVATGRAVDEALGELNAWSAPLPDFLIADVGSSIYRIDPQGRPHPVQAWQDKLDQDWDRRACEQVLSPLPGLRLQPAHTQSAYKLSYFTDDSGASKDSLIVKAKQCLAGAGLEARVVHSHGHLLDILPVASGKARAVDFIRQHAGIARRRVVAAGDSGNDEDMLRYAALGIVVANHSGELNDLKGYEHIFWARSSCAAGILEGLNSVDTSTGRQLNDNNQRHTPLEIDINGNAAGMEAGA